ncbi:MAG: hypothetical protein ACM3NQ_10480 [Bacteroidales bacterium]
MTEQPTPGAGPAKPADRFVMLVLAYLWVLALVPLLADHSDSDVRWHAKHGLVLTVVELGALVAWSIVFGVLWIMTGGLFGCVTTLQIVLSPLVGLVILGFHVFLIIKALQGERVVVPYVSEYANRF